MLSLATGATSISIDVQIVDDAGLPVTGLIAATFPTLTISRGTGADVAFPALSDLSALTDAFSAGGVKERGGGTYRLDVPNDVGSTAATKVTIRGEATGKRLICPPIQVGYLPGNVVQFNGSAGTFSGGRPEVNATHWGGTAVASAGIATEATASAAASSAASADGKLTTGRLSRIDRLPDIVAGAAGGVSLVGSAMTLDSATLTALFADADVAGLIASITALFDEATDLPVETIAAKAATATVAAIVANGSIVTLLADAAAAKVAAESADGKLTGPRLAKIDGAMQAGADGDTGKTLSDQIDGISAGAIADATLDELLSGHTVNGSVGKALTDLLAAGGSLTPEQAAQLDAIEAGVGRIRGSALNWTGNVGDGGRLILTLGDDHETIVGNSLPIHVNDPGQLLYSRLTAGSTTLQWAAGQGTEAALIAGTVSDVSEADGITTITVEVPDCTAAGNTLIPYQWQLQRTTSGKRVRELKGTLTLEQDMIGS